jgi:hypothetical protein
MTGHPVKQVQEAGDRVTLDSHGCSLRIPRGWTQKAGAQNSAMFVAPPDSGYVANFSVMSEPFAGSLREYADANVASVKSAAPQAVFKGDTPFATENGASSFEAAFTNKMNDLELAQAMYFFDGPSGRKILVTTTAQQKDDAELKPLFEACIKTLAVTAK